MNPQDNEEGKKFPTQDIPEGYLSLEQFEEIFHKKLDAFYRNN